MKHLHIILLALATLLAGACSKDDNTSKPADNIYQFKVLDGQGDSVSLEAYKGQVLLVVNTATQCGYTPQYEDLERIYQAYKEQGFTVLDFPCNQFGQQAPGSNEEIHAFCTGTYSTTFPQMAKIDVNGDSATALYVWLKSKAPFGGFDTTDPRGAYLDKIFRQQDPEYDKNPDIKWNFTKFLIDRQGNVVRRFEPTVPMVLVKAAIEELL